MLKYSYDATGNLVSRTLQSDLISQIIGQPVNQIVAPGETASFSVVVSDASGRTFQWVFDHDIPGATGDSLLLTNVSADDEGTYVVVVRNSFSDVISAPASLLLDSDGDGLPDSWEIAKFGDTTTQRSEGDADADGISNLDEFLDGTNPTSKTSLRPRLIAYSDAGGSVTVEPMKLSYDLGETVTLTATPFAPSVFVGWKGDLTDASFPTDLTMKMTINANKTVRAKFASVLPLPPGLVAFWRGETDASDLIGGHHGTFFAGTSETAPTVTPSGKVGGAFDFDGKVHVEVPDSAELKPVQITLEAWVFPTLFDFDYHTVITRGSMEGNDPGVPAPLRNHAWYLGLLSEANVVSAGRPHFRTSSDILRGPEIPLNEWTHLAASFDGATKRLYVNGVLVASRAGLEALVYDPAAVPVTIGSDFASGPSSNALHFHGRIDEVGIYNRALTSNEIVEIYNADLAGRNFFQPYFTSPRQLPDAALGTSYTQQVTTILGIAPVSFSQGVGALPPGMTLSSTGVVTGVPSVLGTFDFTVLATDAVGVSAEQVCVLRVL